MAKQKIEQETFVCEAKNALEKRKLYHVVKITIDEGKVSTSETYSKEYWKIKQYFCKADRWIKSPLYKTFKSESKGRDWVNEIG